MEIERIIDSILLEKKRGFDNKSVIRGFSNFILKELAFLENLGLNIKRIEELMIRYEDFDREKRERAIKEIINIILDEIYKLRNVGLEKLPGVGDKRRNILEKLGLYTLYDLIYFFPRRYIDFGKLTSIGRVKNGESVQIQGEVVSVSHNISRRKGIDILKVRFFDGTGSINGVWFNQPYLAKFFKRGKRYLLMGKVKYNFGEWQIENPEFEELRGVKNSSGEKIIPIYSQTRGLSSKMISRYVEEALKIEAPLIFDPLPKTILRKRSLLDIKPSLYNIHFPKNKKLLNLSQKRLIYEELFLFQLFLLLRKRKIKEKKGRVYSKVKDLREKFLSSLPFSLTKGQLKVIREIEEDLTSGKVMNRLLHGEVGSGKTVVVAYFLYLTAMNGYQGAIMSPTEILANQTGEVIKKFLSPFNIRVEVLTRSTKNKTKIKEEISRGNIQIVVGTHALLEEDVVFKNLAFVSVDEQHRFGVLQRAELVKKGEFPHTLVLSATPIPRTLALSLYGDLDISFIGELPPGRKPVKTYVFPGNMREKAYELVRKRLIEGEKIYIVCPFIEESEKMDVASAKKKYEEFKKIFKGFKVSLLHGKMKSEEKERIIGDFRTGDTQILVSTSIIEVGIDVPEATVILIEDANRFGLLQLHQLRGRVGRGEKESYCLLITSRYDEDTLKRLRILERTNSGLKVSEWDLKFRGTGELGGERQHGVSEFKMANLLREDDIKILEMAKKDAEEFLKREKISDYPLLLKELIFRFKPLKYLDIS